MLFKHDVIHLHAACIIYPIVCLDISNYSKCIAVTHIIWINTQHWKKKRIPNIPTYGFFVVDQRFCFLNTLLSCLLTGCTAKEITFHYEIKIKYTFNTNITESQPNITSSFLRYKSNSSILSNLTSDTY